MHRLEELAGQLEAIVPGAMVRYHVPGVSLALFAGDGEILTRVYGETHAGTGLLLGPGTLFEAASLTKPVFATLVMGLVERGLLDLDAPITAYLPPGWCEHFDLQAITPRMILSHRTGLPNWVGAADQPAMVAAPGERHTYSGLGYMYLQMAWERLAGQNVQDAFNSGLRSQTGMMRSSLTWIAASCTAGVTPLPNAAAQSPDSGVAGGARYDERGLAAAAIRPHPGSGSPDARCAMGHDNNGILQVKRDWPAPMAAASLHSTPANYARFMSLFLCPRDLPGVISAAGLQAMLQPASPGDHGVAWGLGWGLEETDSGRMFWHWGSNAGYKSFGLASHRLGLGLVVMTNGNQGESVNAELVHACFPGPHPALH